MIDMSLLITAFVALFVVIDPIGTTPVFMALTSGIEAKRRRNIALRACVIAALLLLVFGLLGDSVLQFLGISLPAFRVAGGILLFLTALDMLFDRRSQRRKDQVETAQADEDHSDDPSIFPLAIPLIAGPGSIATIILLTGQTNGDPLLLTGYLLVMIAVVCAVFLMFLAAPALERILGDIGILVATRLLGMLLAALSVQFVLDGITGFLQAANTPS